MASRLPALFLSHGGGPSFLFDHPAGSMMAEMGRSSRAASFLRNLREHPSLAPCWPPAAMLVISAHWEEAAFTVQEHHAPPLLYDYYGFPPEAYALNWAPPGAPALAARVRGLLERAGLPAAGDARRGYDHGLFVPLMVVAPEASIPTLQLSLHHSLDPHLHLRLGAALAPLRDEGVIIIGSGFATHNLGEFRGSAPGQPSRPWLTAFDGWLKETITRVTPAERARRLAAAEQEAPEGSFRKAHPREEHWLPLLVAAGAAAPEVVEGVETADVDVAGRTNVSKEGGSKRKHSEEILFEQHINGAASMACFLMS